MKKTYKICLFIIPAALLLPCLFYCGLLFLGHNCNPHFLKIDRCLDLGGKWDYERNTCEYVEGGPKEWHVSPSKDPRSSIMYPFVSWATIREIRTGMNENELKSLIGNIQNYHHPINAIVFTVDPDGNKYEVAIKLSKKLTVEDLSFKEINF